MAMSLEIWHRRNMSYNKTNHINYKTNSNNITHQPDPWNAHIARARREKQMKFGNVAMRYYDNKKEKEKTTTKEKKRRKKKLK